MNNTTKTILGLAVAAAAGAAIGMLLAPEKGTDLQKKIKEGAEDWLKEFNGLIETGKEAFNQVKSSAVLEPNSMRRGLAELNDSETLMP